MVSRQMAGKADVWKNNWAVHCFNVNAKAKKSCQSSGLLNIQNVALEAGGLRWGSRGRLGVPGLSPQGVRELQKVLSTIDYPTRRGMMTGRFWLQIKSLEEGEQGFQRSWALRVHSEVPI